MIQLALLLFGDDFIFSKRKQIILFGILWSTFGTIIFIDGLDGVTYFPLRFFGLLLLTESLVTLIIASESNGGQKTLLYFKGGIFCFISILILSNISYCNFLLAIIFCFSYFSFGFLMTLSSWFLRFPRWKTFFMFGTSQIIFSILMITPYPTHYKATVSFILGSIMFFSGINTVKLALRIRSTHKENPLSKYIATKNSYIKKNKNCEIISKDMESYFTDVSVPLIVHIWTPEGTASTSIIRRPIINRYIAAVDSDGVISTGHASLEIPNSIYISLYPAEDIDRSPSEFVRILKATCDNNVAGKFLPDYSTEAAEWCHSNKQIFFTKYNIKSLQCFWSSYKETQTYNLTLRNCSSSVAYALESALNGVLSDRSKNWFSIIRTLTMPEFWIAAQIRKRAISMAWTPGLVMDYARALYCIINPVSPPWYQRIFLLWRRSKKYKTHYHK
ncbi:MFS transporter [Escherichia coli]|nr:MFS transporter [Escherichia coli]